LKIGSVRNVEWLFKSWARAKYIAVWLCRCQGRIKRESLEDRSEKRVAGSRVVLAHFRQLGEADEKLACPIDDLFLGVGNIISIVQGVSLDLSDGQSTMLKD